MGISLARGTALVTRASCLDRFIGRDAGQGARPGDTGGGIEAFRRVQCSTVDKQPVFYYWVGETFSRVPGEPDRKLFRFQGMNVRQCVTVTDPVRGVGFRQVSRRGALLRGSATGQIIDEWKKPVVWRHRQGAAHRERSGELPRSIFPQGADGKPYRSEVRP